MSTSTFFLSLFPCPTHLSLLNTLTLACRHLLLKTLKLSLILLMPPGSHVVGGTYKKIWHMYGTLSLSFSGKKESERSGLGELGLDWVQPPQLCQSYHFFDHSNHLYV